jgi:hypothetical protein
METVTSLALQEFFRRVGERIESPITFYLLGGSALCLLGSPRETLDVDYFIEQAAPDVDRLLQQLAVESKLDLESVPLAEFIPLPPGAEQRRRFIGLYGRMAVYLFDLYSIALSKIARGFESDLEDVLFLLKQNLIDWATLETHFNSILPRARSADIDPREFQAYFLTLKRNAGLA